MNEIKVSVVCNAYNHELYIRDALDGFLMQKTSFPFEVLIHDDASTDNTAAIIREYEEKYPDIIKPIYQTENQYSKGLEFIAKFQYSRVKGKYVAFCEGDDYWTDPLKLQKQYDIMEQHPEVDICAHGADVVEADTKRFLDDLCPDVAKKLKEPYMILTTGQVIACKGRHTFVATNSLLCRKELNDNVPKFREYFPFDATFRIHGSLRGGMLYLQDKMSVYRKLAKGSWTSRTGNNLTKLKETVKQFNTALTMLDEGTNGKYHDVIAQSILENELIAMDPDTKARALLTPKYKAIYKSYSLKARLKIKLKAWFPFLRKIKNAFRKKKD